MESNNRFLGLLLGIGLLATIFACVGSGSSSREKVAIRSFEGRMSEREIDKELFEGPILVRENEKISEYKWISTAPNFGDAEFKMVVSDRSRDINVYEITGKRKSLLCLRLTSIFPLNEAILITVFGIPPSPKAAEGRLNRLREASLSGKNIEALADFLEIKTQLINYYFEHEREYPTDLLMLDIDDLYIRDEYDKYYVYENMGDFVILGTRGENNVWDFERFTLDAIYGDEDEHLLANGDDILAKFRP